MIGLYFVDDAGIGFHVDAPVVPRVGENVTIYRDDRWYCADVKKVSYTFDGYAMSQIVRVAVTPLIPLSDDDEAMFGVQHRPWSK